MGTTLYAGAARRTINPLLGTGKGGLRLFGVADPGDRERPDGDGARPRRRRHQGRADRDRPLRAQRRGGRSAARAPWRRRSAVPVSHVLLNLSHNHSSPALAGFMEMTDTAEEAWFRARYEHDLRRWLVEAARGGGRGPAAGADRHRLGRERDRRLPARGARRPRRARRGARPSHRHVRRRDPRRRPRRATRSPSSSATPPTRSRSGAGRRSPRPTTRARRARCSSATSAASPSSSRAAAATSTPASGSATRSTAATRRTASASSSAARR